MMRMQETTGLQLRIERTAQGVRQYELARAAGKRPEWVSRLEARRVVPADQARAYRDALASCAVFAGSEGLR